MEIFLAIFSSLFSVANPLGAMPVFIMLTEGSTLLEKRRQAFKISFYVISILLLFFFSGNLIPDFFRHLGHDIMKLTWDVEGMSFVTQLNI